MEKDDNTIAAIEISAMLLHIIVFFSIENVISDICCCRGVIL